MSFWTELKRGRTFKKRKKKFEKLVKTIVPKQILGDKRLKSIKLIKDEEWKQNFLSFKNGALVKNTKVAPAFMGYTYYTDLPPNRLPEILKSEAEGEFRIFVKETTGDCKDFDKMHSHTACCLLHEVGHFVAFTKHKDHTEKAAWIWVAKRLRKLSKNKREKILSTAKNQLFGIEDKKYMTLQEIFRKY